MDERQMKSSLTTKTECVTVCPAMNQYMMEVQSK